MTKRKRESKPPKLATTRFDDPLGQRLRWHFSSEASDSGVRSSHGPLTDMALAGPPTGGARRAPDAHINDKWSDRMNAHRRIHAALAQLSQEHRDVLAAAYGEEPPPREVGLRFSGLGGCARAVLVSKVALALFVTDGDQRRAKNVDPESLRAMQTGGVGEWLRSPEPTEKESKPKYKAITDAIAVDASALLDAARLEFIRHYGDVQREAHKVRITALRRTAAELVEPLRLTRRTSLAC